MIARYWRFVKGYYVKEGQPTSEVASIKLALRFVRRLYGRRAASAFRPKHLKAVREAMIVHEITRQVKVVNADTGETSWERKVVRKGMARKCINRMIGRVKRMFAWAVEEELVTVATHSRLQRVRGLRRGKSAARETRRVRQVPPDHIEAVLPHVPPLVRAMIEVQLLCGGRPQDVVQLRAADIDSTGPVWEYRPRRFKTEHHNDDEDPNLDRVVYLGPRCQEILRPLLPADADEYIFTPSRSEAARNTVRRENRASPMTPSQESRQPKGRTNAPFHQHYPVASFRQAIRRACIRAGIPIWMPNQLRHSRLTDVRKRYGLEASRVCGGHREIGVTQMYAEQDQDLARQVMTEIG